MEDYKCKICRRLGAKLFLKGERCLSPKCAFVRKPYPPGKKKRVAALSAFSKELQDKQKLKNWYNLNEHQFKNYVRKVLEKRGKVPDTSEFLIDTLERRLDNVIFRLGLAVSRPQAKQLVRHGHFLVNDKKVDIPSFRLRKGDKITVASGSENKTIFKNAQTGLRKEDIPSWLSLDLRKKEAKVVGNPSLEEAAPPAEVSAVFEFYSR